MENDPSVPIRSHPFPSVPFSEGLQASRPFPLPSSPPLGGGRRERMGVETKKQNGNEEIEGVRSLSEHDLPEEVFWPAVPIAEVADEWTILRCASRVTIDLALELRGEHLLAWSPVIRVQKRLPRRRKTTLVVRSLIPSFVFVAKDHGDWAIDLAMRGRVHQCKRFLFNDGEVTVPGNQLAPLHLAQIRGTLRKRPLEPGDKVEILATVLYLAKGKVLRGPFKSDSYEVELEGQRQRLIFPGFLLRKTVT